MSRLRFLFHYIQLHKISYLAGIVFIILTNWIAVTIPTYLQRSIDILEKGDLNLTIDQNQLVKYLTVMFLLAGTIIVVRILSRVFFFNPGRAIEFQIKNDLVSKLTLLQKDYYDENQTGAIISRIQNDITGVRLICGFGMMQIFNILTALSLVPYNMWQLSKPLTLYCVIPIIGVFILVRFGMRYIVRYSRERMGILQDLSSFIVSSLSGVDVIKSYSFGNWISGKFEKHNRLLLDRSLRIAFVRSFLMPILTNLENILKVLILMVGGLLIIKHEFTIGELTAFIAYAGLLTLPITGLGWLTTVFQQGLVGLDSLQTILNRDIPEANIEPLPSEQRSALFQSGIEIRNLSITYAGQSEPVLKNISFRIEPNQTVGILGKIGSGKTTLINCLNRYLPIQKGQIYLGDIDLYDLSLQDLRKTVRTVTQDVFLFSDSVRENLRFGLADGSELQDELLEEVLHESALKEEVDRFEDKLETMVGEKGIMLSGGQKQRISLARAIMAECDLLILDNVLSAVDQQTEQKLLKHILQRRRSKSLLLVSHRVQALEKSDLILVLEGGQIIERGTHTDLINKEGFYKTTWELQQDS